MLPSCAPFQSLPGVKASVAALFRSAPAFGGSGAEMRWRGEAATEGLSHAHFSRHGYWFYALFSFAGPLRGAVLLARPKVPKNRTGVPPAPRHPEPNAATLDCAFTEHCPVPWRTAKRGGPQAPFSVILSVAKDLTVSDLNPSSPPGGRRGFTGELVRPSNRTHRRCNRHFRRSDCD